MDTAIQLLTIDQKEATKEMLKSRIDDFSLQCKVKVHPRGNPIKRACVIEFEGTI